MRRALLPLALLICCNCSDDAAPDARDTDAATEAPPRNGDGPDAARAAQDAGDERLADGGALSGSRDHDAAAVPEQGKPGCGFEAAAFCATFDAPAEHQGRARELDAALWGGARTEGQLSTTTAMGIGMAVIPRCRADVPTQVWTAMDTLICDPSADVASHHLLVATAAQNYGQNSYRVRQPFDFAGRTGKVVFDATVNKLSPLHAWVSIAITEDPMSAPGYAILGNDEGSIIPRNAVEVHFANFNDETRITPRNIHIFRDYVDTVYEPPQASTAPAFVPGKLNHFEVSVSEQGVVVTITPYSQDGLDFGAPEARFEVNAPVPFSRGYVHLSVHNHAMVKYTQPDRSPAVLDASVALIDNVGFDGPVLPRSREYEVPDSLVQFHESLVGDPYNADDLGYDIGYVLNDASEGPRQVLRLANVDPEEVTRARLAFSTWLDFQGGGGLPPEQFAFRARVNGKGWHERRMNAAELGFFARGPTVLDQNGAPFGDPHSQGRLALMLDIPVDELKAGENTLELVTSGIATSYPPLAYNIDLLLDPR